jgi:hypothetical protein
MGVEEGNHASRRTPSFVSIWRDICSYDDSAAAIECEPPRAFPDAGALADLAAIAPLPGHEVAAFSRAGRVSHLALYDGGVTVVHSVSGGPSEPVAAVGLGWGDLWVVSETPPALSRCSAVACTSAAIDGGFAPAVDILHPSRSVLVAASGPGRSTLNWKDSLQGSVSGPWERLGLPMALAPVSTFAADSNGDVLVAGGEPHARRPTTCGWTSSPTAAGTPPPCPTSSRARRSRSARSPSPTARGRSARTRSTSAT